ncbi:hypothetical protein IV102_38500 [bacterium]|nr:hypothetical protein [bacterium]
MQAGYEADLALVQQTLTNQVAYLEGNRHWSTLFKNGRYCLSSLGLSQPVWRTELLQQFKQRYP